MEYTHRKIQTTHVALITASCSCDHCVQNEQNDYIVDVHLYNKITHYFIAIFVGDIVFIYYIIYFVNAGLTVCVCPRKSAEN